MVQSEWEKPVCESVFRIKLTFRFTKLEPLQTAVLVSVGQLKVSLPLTPRRFPNVFHTNRSSWCFFHYSSISSLWAIFGYGIESGISSSTAHVIIVRMEAIALHAASTFGGGSCG